jgi:hypothetical protein
LGFDEVYLRCWLVRAHWPSRVYPDPRIARQAETSNIYVINDLERISSIIGFTVL